MTFPDLIGMDPSTLIEGDPALDPEAWRDDDEEDEPEAAGEEE